MRAGKVTGADVAKAAGVSRATVSYVMNDTAGQTIPEETRKRVLTAAKKLGYVPHMAGRTLRTGRSDLVAWILPDWPIGSQIGRLIEALSREASRRKFTLAVVQEAEGVARLEATIRTLAPAALIAMHTLPKPIVEYAKAAGIPIASTFHVVDEAQNDDTALSAQEVGRMQVEYLVQKGHRQIAYLYPDDPRVELFASNRLIGARDVAKQHGLPALRKRTAPLDREALARLAQEWQKAGVTAVCGYNDEWAMGLLSGMHMVGMSAPKDLAIIGCDDILTAPVASPPLTTIAQSVEPMAVRLLNAVEQGLGISDTAGVELLPPTTLVPRESA